MIKLKAICGALKQQVKTNLKVATKERLRREMEAVSFNISTNNVQRLIFFLFYVCFVLSVQYVLHLKGYLQEWRKNPHWSFTCCLALFLPINSLQGDIRGLTETNVFKTRLQSGEFEMVTLQAAVQDSGAIDVTLEEGEQGDDSTMEVEDDVCQVTTNSNKCNQGAQTEVFCF